jgi:hypothetical protein
VFHRCCAARLAVRARHRATSASATHNEAIGSLQEEAIRLGDRMITYLDWALATLAGDPRYQTMLGTLNLPNLFAQTRGAGCR